MSESPHCQSTLWLEILWLEIPWLEILWLEIPEPVGLGCPWRRRTPTLSGF